MSWPANLGPKLAFREAEPWAEAHTDQWPCDRKAWGVKVANTYWGILDDFQHSFTYTLLVASGEKQQEFSFAFYIPSLLCWRHHAGGFIPWSPVILPAVRLPSEFTSKPAGDGFTSSLGEQSKRLTINVGLQCLETKVGDRIGIDYNQVVGTLISCMDPGHECSHVCLK